VKGQHRRVARSRSIVQITRSLIRTTRASGLTNRPRVTHRCARGADPAVPRHRVPHVTVDRRRDRITPVHGHPARSALGPRWESAKRRKTRRRNLQRNRSSLRDGDNTLTCLAIREQRRLIERSPGVKRPFRALVISQIATRRISGNIERAKRAKRAIRTYRRPLITNMGRGRRGARSISGD